MWDASQGENFAATLQIGMENVDIEKHDLLDRKDGTALTHSLDCDGIHVWMDVFVCITQTRRFVIAIAFRRVD